MKLNRIFMAAALLAASTTASAVVVTIDDFNSPSIGPVSAALATTVAFSDAVRSGTFTTLAGPANGSGATLKIGAGTFPVGVLEVANASGRNSEVTISWSVAAGLLPANALNVAFFMEVVQSDGNPTNLSFTLDGNPLAGFLIAPNTSSQGLSFGLSGGQIASLSGGGSLGLRLSGASGWDLTADQLGFSYDVPTPPVPEPATYLLALGGLAVVGARVARRRKA